jgi:hypothetical protein
LLVLVLVLPLLLLRGEDTERGSRAPGAAKTIRAAGPLAEVGAFRVTRRGARASIAVSRAFKRNTGLQEYYRGFSQDIRTHFHRSAF